MERESSEIVVSTHTQHTVQFPNVSLWTLPPGALSSAPCVQTKVSWGKKLVTPLPKMSICPLTSNQMSQSMEEASEVFSPSLMQQHPNQKVAPPHCQPFTLQFHPNHSLLTQSTPTIPTIVQSKHSKQFSIHSFQEGEDECEDGDSDDLQMEKKRGGEMEESSSSTISLECSPELWSVEQVCSYISSIPGCQNVAHLFRLQEIDGKALLLLTEKHLLSCMNIKLGPALKIWAEINVLQQIWA
ncbi:polyhomeotic-like protein 3 isoform X2 [Hoplias malabaricus]|uniref:polyhomeotic-like protein 3 isoform X2 n=1 Tax=Hoplias malabaricus TaxID=27720 RepID=UPI0034627503